MPARTLVRGRARGRGPDRHSGGPGPRREDRAPISGLVRHPRTEEPCTNAEVARMSVGALTEDAVEGMRTGRISDPTVSQVAALAAVFGVEPSYLVDQDAAPTLDAETLVALADEITREITREALRLPERERVIVLTIVRQFGAQGPPPSGKSAVLWPSG